MTQLIATKRLRYASRAFEAGDRFAARSERDAQILVYGTKKARFAETAKATPTDPELERLRARAEALGVKVDKRWGVLRLNEAIAAARA